jgi:uncharacterized protein GlcG (DUF336 family)
MRKPAIAAIVAVALGLAGVAGAAGPFNDQPAGPRSLPGDLLPPFAMLDADGKLPPPPALPDEALLPGPGGLPESTAPGPDLDQAMALALAALRACEADGFRVGVAVIDSVGEARAMLTADGSDGSHVFVAMRKALVAQTFAMPSSQAAALVAASPDQLARVTPAMFVEGGALPIMREGQVIGAIGVSGAAGPVIGQQDEACAATALNGAES